MKFEVKFSCGHTGTVELFGKMADRKKKIAWLEENGVCDACKAKHVEESASANKYELTGSKKQIAWAADIIDGLQANFKLWEENIENAYDTDGAKYAHETADFNRDGLQKLISTMKDAKFWIEHRDYFNHIQDELNESVQCKINKALR